MLNIQRMIQILTPYYQTIHIQFYQENFLIGEKATNFSHQLLSLLKWILVGKNGVDMYKVAGKQNIKRNFCWWESIRNASSVGELSRQQCIRGPRNQPYMYFYSNLCFNLFTCLYLYFHQPKRTCINNKKRD